MLEADAGQRGDLTGREERLPRGERRMQAVRGVPVIATRAAVGDRQRGPGVVVAAVEGHESVQGVVSSAQLDHDQHTIARGRGRRRTRGRADLHRRRAVVAGPRPDTTTQCAGGEQTAATDEKRRRLTPRPVSISGSFMPSRIRVRSARAPRRDGPSPTARSACVVVAPNPVRPNAAASASTSPWPAATTAPLSAGAFSAIAAARLKRATTVAEAYHASPLGHPLTLGAIVGTCPASRIRPHGPSRRAPRRLPSAPSRATAPARDDRAAVDTGGEHVGDRTCERSDIESTRGERRRQLGDRRVVDFRPDGRACHSLGQSTSRTPAGRRPRSTTASRSCTPS